MRGSVATSRLRIFHSVPLFRFEPVILSDPHVSLCISVKYGVAGFWWLGRKLGRGVAGFTWGRGVFLWDCSFERRFRSWLHVGSMKIVPGTLRGRLRG